MNVISWLTFLGVIATLVIAIAIYRKGSQPVDTSEAVRRIEAATARLTTTTGRIATETTTAEGIEPSAPTEGT